jgi:hypothetical protein
MHTHTLTRALIFTSLHSLHSTLAQTPLAPTHHITRDAMGSVLKYLGEISHPYIMPAAISAFQETSMGTAVTIRDLAKVQLQRRRAREEGEKRSTQCTHSTSLNDGKLCSLPVPAAGILARPDLSEQEHQASLRQEVQCQEAKGPAGAPNPALWAPNP